jgi:glycerol-3-phosphate dehydrogenase
MNRRECIWSNLDTVWDVLIIGGGITGAGILREASRAGLKALLVEAKDFSSGTSSRSSKLVHGGLRYLQNGQVKLTFESVRERERLLNEGRGLVQPLGFLLPTFRGDRVPAWLFGTGLIVYDVLATRFSHRRYNPDAFMQFCPDLRREKLSGGFRFFDAQTDDARLVLRVIQEAEEDGGVALNYARAVSLLKDAGGRVCGAALQDTSGQARSMEVQARVVINATGVWADELRGQVGGRARLRPLRGSHLVFSAGRVPVNRAVSFLHPADGRPVMVLPWEGVTMLGTTDIDHREDLESEPFISSLEAEYLMEGIRYIFPEMGLEQADVISSFAGVRGVVDTGKINPSKESREHVLWKERGLLTITGGKLTTFRLMANAALRAVRSQLPGRERFRSDDRMLNKTPESGLFDGLDPRIRQRLTGRYGKQALAVLDHAGTGEMAPFAESTVLAAELRHAARTEQVVHLDDLLLRRTRLGMLVPHGGLDRIEDIRGLVQPELGWDDVLWEQEAERYAGLWSCCYGPPGS